MDQLTHPPPATRTPVASHERVLVFYMLVSKGIFDMLKEIQKIRVNYILRYFLIARILEMPPISTPEPMIMKATSNKFLR